MRTNKDTGFPGNIEILSYSAFINKYFYTEDIKMTFAIPIKVYVMDDDLSLLQSSQLRELRKIASSYEGTLQVECISKMHYLDIISYLNQINDGN